MIKTEMGQFKDRIQLVAEISKHPGILSQNYTFVNFAEP